MSDYIFGWHSFTLKVSNLLLNIESHVLERNGSGAWTDKRGDLGGVSWVFMSDEEKQSFVERYEKFENLKYSPLSRSLSGFVDNSGTYETSIYAGDSLLLGDIPFEVYIDESSGRKVSSGFLKIDEDRHAVFQFTVSKELFDSLQSSFTSQSLNLFLGVHRKGKYKEASHGNDIIRVENGKPDLLALNSLNLHLNPQSD